MDARSEDERPGNNFAGSKALCDGSIEFDPTVQKVRMQGARPFKEQGVLSRTLSDENGGQRSRRPFSTAGRLPALLCQ